MERESFKEYSEATTAEKRRALIDEILLRGTSSFLSMRRDISSSAVKTEKAKLSSSRET